jgi:choline-sulfatase
MDKHPNILFLMSDEHRADVAGYEGNSVVSTPVLDELARTGVVFRNAYTPSPICVPARQCMMSGQLPRTCNCRSYGDDLAPGYLTFARHFSEYAYHTVCCGKLHHMGTDQMQGWRRRIGFDDIHVDTRYVANRQEEEFARYRGPGYKWDDTKEVLRAGVGRSPHAIADEVVMQGALNFIDLHFNNSYYDKTSNGQPLFLKVSLLQPHYPYFTDEQKFGRYLNRVQPFLNEVPFDHPFLGQRQVRVGLDATERDIRRATAAYYGMVETIDTYYGSTLDALRHVGEDLDDWIIIYTSDHGEMLGEHGIWEKQKFFEASVRVPLIIRAPNHFAGGRVVEENVNLCDLFATLCDLAGLSVPTGLDSRSMVPLLSSREANDGGAQWNNETISQFGTTNLMIKRDHLKYQYYGPDMPEVLFDLQANPEETVNLIADPNYLTAVQQFRQRSSQLGYGSDADHTYVNAGYSSAI